MNANLFTDDDAKPALRAVDTNPQARLLEMLTLTLGLGDTEHTIVALEQDGRDPEDAQFVIELNTGARISLGPIGTLMNRGKVRDALLVRLGVTPPAMKAADWQDTIAQAIAGAAQVVQSAEALASRAQDWVDQYLAGQPVTPDVDTACLAREPYRDETGRIHIALAPVAKFVARTTTEQITERKLAGALKDSGWAQHTVAYWTEGRDEDGKGRGKRTTASYWRGPEEEKA